MYNNSQYNIDTVKQFSNALVVLLVIEDSTDLEHLFILSLPFKIH